jgi:tetratricopeptide (TPR) repeat protein
MAKSARLLLSAILLAAGAAWWWTSSPADRPAPAALRPYRTGLDALRGGRYFTARQSLAQAAAADPQFLLAHARLAEADYELDLMEKARGEMPAADDQPYLQALQLTLTGKLTDVAALARDAASHAPSDERAGAYIDLGRAEERAGLIADATEAYRIATRRDARNAAAWLRLGAIYGHQLQQERAQQAFDHAAQLYRDAGDREGETEVQYQRALADDRLGNSAEARTLWQQVAQNGSFAQQIAALLQLGETAGALDIARTQGAEYLAPDLEIARRFHMEHSEARLLVALGSEALRATEFDEAIGKLNAALALLRRAGYRQETANALDLLARAQRRKGDLAAALATLTEEVQIGDAAAAAHEMGAILLEQGRLPDAAAAFQQAAQSARKAHDLLAASYDLLDLADVYSRQGRYDEARQAIDNASPSSSRAVAELADERRAELALRQHDYARAIDLSQQVLRGRNLGVDLTVAAKSTLGSALTAAGRRAEGLALLAEAVRLAAESDSPLVRTEARQAYAAAH